MNEWLNSNKSGEKQMPQFDIPVYDPTKSGEKKEDSPLKSQISEFPIELNKRIKTGKKLTIASVKRDISLSERNKSRAAVMAGICILGAAAASYFNNQDVNMVIDSELKVVYSWEALGKYIEDLGALTTLLSMGAVGFLTKYLVNSKKLKNAQHDLENLMNYLGLDFGGNENAKTR